MQYDPIKRSLGKIFNRNLFLRIFFFRLLDLLLLRSWHIRRDLRILKRNGFDENSALKFLSDENIIDDWSLCTEGDSYSLFGPSEDRLSWMPLESSQLESLIDWLDEEVPIKGCNHDLSLTTEWLKANNCPVHPTLMALLAHGGGCDCEVVMNVEAEGIYP